jgi:outer membrane protein OmpA-like peptidoglycan-associated protein
MDSRYLFPALLALLVSIVNSSCVQNSSTGQMTAAGAGIGGVTGALLGSAIGKTAQSKITGTTVGTGVGALAGYAFAQYLDIQEAELRNQFKQSKDVSISRESTSELSVGFNSKAMFSPGSAVLLPTGRQEIRNTSGVLKKYPKSVVVVQGELDNVKADELGQRLSVRRTEAVRQELIANGIAGDRLVVNQPLQTRSFAPDTSSGTPYLSNAPEEKPVVSNTPKKKHAVSKTPKEKPAVSGASEEVPIASNVSGDGPRLNRGIQLLIREPNTQG